MEKRRFNSYKDGILAPGKAHVRSGQSSTSFPIVAFETEIICSYLDSQKNFRMELTDYNFAHTYIYKHVNWLTG